MPSLICDLRPDAASLLHEYRALREAGEAVALFWPSVRAPALEGVRLVPDAPALDACFDAEQVAVMIAAELPAWLPFDDFHRVLLITAGPDPSPVERALAQRLLARGCDTVEMLVPACAADLVQSWNSGRRTGAVVLRAGS